MLIIYSHEFDHPKLDITIQIFFFQLAIAIISRVLWLTNCCINPVIYASTIPAFKKLIKELFTCNSSSNERHESGHELIGTVDTRENKNQGTETSL